MFLIVMDARFSNKSHLCSHCLNYLSQRNLCRYIKNRCVMMSTPSFVTESECLRRYRYLIEPSICIESNNQLAIC